MLLCLRFIGVSLLKASGKWSCKASLELKNQHTSGWVALGSYPSEEQAGQAYDKALIYQARTHSQAASASMQPWSSLQCKDGMTQAYAYRVWTRETSLEKATTCSSS